MNKFIPIKHDLQKSTCTVGIDALLLVGFVLSFNIKLKKFVELGVGDGLASCILALNIPQSSGFGLDIQPDALKAATQNAQVHNLENRLHFAQAQVEHKEHVVELYKHYMDNELADMVMTNPPYHKHGSGRLSKDIARKTALHQQAQTLQHFCQTAAMLLKHHGNFYCIYNPKYMTELIHTLPTYKLGIRHLLAIHSHNELPAKWILVHAQKNAQNDIKILPSLSLYHPNNTTELSSEILNFCPWIA